MARNSYPENVDNYVMYPNRKSLCSHSIPSDPQLRDIAKLMLAPLLTFAPLNINRMIYHIVTGDLAAAPLQIAVDKEPSMNGKVIIIKDVLSLGPLQIHQGKRFSEMRSDFWNEVVGNGKNDTSCDDLERLLQTGNEMIRDEKAIAWIWMAGIPADVCTYHWVLYYFKSFLGRLFIVSIAGLPFLNDNGSLFYPGSLGEISANEVVKARKLARPVSHSLAATDLETWANLVKENSGVRVLETNGKITSRKSDFYDAQLKTLFSGQYQKASRITGLAISKFNIPTGDVFLTWRLKIMGQNNICDLRGDLTRTSRDFEVKLNGQ